MPRQDQGFILIVVIWVAALLALVASTFSRSVQTHIRATATLLDSAEAELAADAAVNLAIHDLLSYRQGARTRRRFAIDGTVTACAIEGQPNVSIAIQDAGGKVDLNTASEELLKALIAGAGAESEAAARAAAAIVDFRDGDDNRSPGGAEARDYEEAGRLNGPKNGPFEAVEELGQVLGLEPQVLPLLAQHVTIYSGSSGLDPAAVAPGLADLVARGQSGLSLQIAGPLPGQFAVPSGQKTFVVQAEAQTRAGAVFVREAIVEMPASRLGIHRIKSWRRGPERLAKPADGEGLDRPPC